MSDRPNDPNRERGTERSSAATDADRANSELEEADRYGVDDDRDATDSPGNDGREAGRTDPVSADAQERRGDVATGGDSGTDTGALKWVSGIVSLIGLWIAVSPFVYGTEGAPLWNNVVVGGAILLLAGYTFYRMQTGYSPDVGSTSLTALLGLWAIAAPFLLAYLSTGLVWSTVASGVAVAVLAGYNAYESRRTGTPRTTGARV